MAKKIRFGIVGTGKITEWVLAGAAADARFEATAICSRSEQRADEFARNHGIKHIFTSVAEMAASPLIDAIYIATPNITHAPIAIECMEHGKHVLCEKPMASNAREAMEMVDCAHRNHVLLMEAMIATANPNFTLLQHLMPKLGTIHRYFAAYCQYSSRYDKLKEGIVMNAWKPELANGATMDIGIYTIYPMVALFGEPHSISASGILLETGVDGQGSASFTYPGMNAGVIYSKIANSYLQSEIEGEEANIVIDKIHSIDSMHFVPRPAPGSGRGPEAEWMQIGHPLCHDRYYYEIKEFIDVLQDSCMESAVNSHYNSITTLKIIDEIRHQLGVRYPND
ncbi:MAG: Gfo/Idh/MocA family oxidoreductase [Muribaculaceae bacterium]|nr:Gfo/Idh/MocA family oxidoreductase [Muribaculaceae bacterium]